MPQANAWNCSNSGRGLLSGEVFRPASRTFSRPLIRNSERKDSSLSWRRPETGHSAMITNLPTHESLNNVALRIYFRAWGDLLDVWTDFALMFEQTMDVQAAVENWSTEWKEYLVEAQTDLQSISSALQQSMELALKARVCAVSPYLLLLDSAMKLSASPQAIDFSELRTLDAVDLPGAVNTLTDQPVSDGFITTYTQLRSRRNKITHLGEAGVTMTPSELMRLAVSLYVAVWPDRQWLTDRLNFADSRAAWLHDGKYTSTHMVVLHEWPIVVKLLKKGEFKDLFGQEKSRRRYLCHDCVYEGDTRYAGLEKPECGTAYLKASGTELTCIMCDQTSKVERRKCSSCPGDVIGSDDGKWSGVCHTCGEEVDE